MKIVNVVLAIGTLFILGALISLGISAFYPAPVSPSYPTMPIGISPGPCTANDTQCEQQVAEYQAQQQSAQAAYDSANEAYTAAMGVYNRNLFIIGNIIGIIVFLIGFFLVLYAGLASQGVPIGIMMAGLWSIIYGYARGWGSVDDQLKFFIGLVIAVIVIGGSMWLMQRHAKRQSA